MDSSRPKRTDNNGTAEPGEQQVANIDALPDEVLALILSYVTDGRTLLDRASLVCRRWRAVCRWPYAWSGVTLTCEADHADAARVLLHAPGLHTLMLEPSVASETTTTRRRLESALRRSRVVVSRRVHVTRLAWQALSPEGRLAFAELLRRQRRQLRELDVYLDDGLLLGVIGQLRCLETLALRLGGVGVPYAGELADGLPQLRELRVRTELPWSTVPVSGSLMADLVRGAAATLRTLLLDVNCFQDLCAVLKLRGLKVLVLFVHVPCGTEAAAGTAILAQCRTGLDSLSKLQLIVGYDHNCMPELFETLRDAYTFEVLEFATLRPSVELEFCFAYNYEESSDSDDDNNSGEDVDDYYDNE